MNKQSNIKRLNIMQISSAFLSLGNNLAGVFVPVFMFGMGYSLKAVVLYVFIYSVIMVLNNFSTYLVNANLGTRWSMFLGYLSQSLFFVVLGLNIGEVTKILLLSLFSGLVDGFLWTTQHYIVATATDESKHSSQITKFGIIGNYVRIGALAITFVMSKFSDAKVVIWLAAVACIIAALQVLRLHNIKIKESLNLSRALKEGFTNFSLSNVTTGFVTMFGIFIAYQLKSLNTVAMIVLLSAIIDIVALKFIGKLGDSGRNKQVMKSFSWLALLLSPFLMLARSATSALILSVIQSKIIGYLLVPWVPLYYAKVKKSSSPYTTIFGLELWGDSARALMSGLALVILYALGPDIMFGSMFVIAGLSALPMNLIGDHIHDK